MQASSSRIQRRQQSVPTPPPAYASSLESLHADERRRSSANGNGVLIAVPAVLIPTLLICIAIVAYVIYRQRRIARHKQQVRELTSRDHGFSRLMSFGAATQSQMQSQAAAMQQTSRGSAFPVLAHQSMQQQQQSHAPAVVVHVEPPEEVMTLDIRRPVSYATTIGDDGVPLGVESAVPSSPTSSLHAFSFAEPQTPRRQSAAVSTIAPSSSRASVDSRIWRSTSPPNVPPVPAIPQNFFVAPAIMHYSTESSDQVDDSDDEHAPRLPTLSPVSSFAGTTLRGHIRGSGDSSQWGPMTSMSDAPPVPPLPFPKSPTHAEPPSRSTMSMITRANSMDSRRWTQQMLQTPQSSASDISSVPPLPLPKSPVGTFGAGTTLRGSVQSLFWKQSDLAPPLPTMAHGRESQLLSPSPLDLTPPSLLEQVHVQPRGQELDLRIDTTPEPGSSHLLPRLKVDTASASADATFPHPFVLSSSPAPSQTLSPPPPSAPPAARTRPSLRKRVERGLPPIPQHEEADAAGLTPIPFPSGPLKPRKRKTLLLERRERRLRLALADKSLSAHRPAP